jgi:hypothetical protein
LVALVFDRLPLLDTIGPNCGGVTSPSILCVLPEVTVVVVVVVTFIVVVAVAN